MSQPTPYNKTTDFTEYAAAHTASPYPPALIDGEFNNIEISLDGILTNLALLQRDDGQLKNGLVTLDSLSSAVTTFLQGSDSAWVLKGAWLTTTAYAVYDVVVSSSNTYVCATAHTSGTFATDLAAGKWILIATFDIANDAVTTAKILDRNVTGTKIALATILQENMANDSIGAAQIIANSIAASEMADDAIGLAELAHQTLGQLYTFGAAGVPQMVSAGTTRQVLQVSATGTAPSFAGHGGDWGLVLGAADISTTTAISTSVTNFPAYLMLFKGVSVDTDNVSLEITLSDDSAATYESAGYRYHIETKTSASASYAAAVSDSAASIPIVANLGNASTETADLFIFLHNANGDGSRYVNLSGWVVYRNTSTVIKGGNFIAGLDDVNDITNMKLSVSSGNMDGGRVIIYAIGEGI
ncbi:MAG: hypothetical protein V4721_00490 [Bacteroidota bacterium]